VEHPDYQLGLGLTVQCEGRPLSVGSLRFIGQQSRLDAEILELQRHCHAQGHTLVGIALDGQIVGAVELHAQVRAEAAEVVEGLRRRGIERILIISGDHHTPTAHLAAQLGVEGYFAEALPAEKAEIIRSLQEEGRSVCYVGDGINDAIALSQAEVSISLSGASSVAMDSSQAILMDQTLRHLCPLFDLARASKRNMQQTFAIVVAPHLLSASVALVLHQAFVPAMVLTLLGLFGGVGNALRPMDRTTPDATNNLPGSQAYENQ
jgi:Cu2+-exporting ATPase